MAGGMQDHDTASTEVDQIAVLHRKVGIALKGCEAFGIKTGRKIMKAID